jgi:hypothetical protein
LLFDTGILGIELPEPGELSRSGGCPQPPQCSPPNDSRRGYAAVLWTGPGNPVDLIILAGECSLYTRMLSGFIVVCRAHRMGARRDLNVRPEVAVDTDRSVQSQAIGSVNFERYLPSAQRAAYGKA